MEKIRIDLEEVRALLNRKNEINALDIREIEWYEDGKPLEIPPECLDKWRFIGLTNVFFVELEFWKESTES